ncbi:MAG: Nif11 family protein [Cyanobium sp. M30B3]|nr:MAG: Nif11 family protein [Cyanobium sp. M30B3]
MSKAQLIAFLARVDADVALKLKVDAAADASAVVAAMVALGLQLGPQQGEGLWVMSAVAVARDPGGMDEVVITRSWLEGDASQSSAGLDSPWP